MTEKHLPPLDLTGPASQVAERWRKWKRAFEYYAEGKGIENVRKKTSQLLHFAGMEVQDIFEDLQDPGPVPEEGDNAYKIAIRKLDSYFRVEENIPYERHVFRQLTPQDGETADQFMVRLRKQARHCNFGTSLNDNLRDQLIEKLTDFELKRKLLEQRNITLEEALDTARAWEAAGRQATNMTVSPPTPQVVEDSVNAVKTRQGKGDEKSRKCYNCGREGHLATDWNCPAKGKKCAKCGRYGHFALCCQGKSDSCGSKSKTNQRRPSHNANFVGDQEVSDSEEDCAFAFAVTENREETCNVISSKEPVVEVSVSGITTRVLIDSGSVSNLIGMKQYEELKAQGLTAKMEDCNKRLYAYGGKELEVIGQVGVEISAGDKKINSHLVVTKTGRCLLGHETSRDLGLLRIGLGASGGSVQCNVVGEDLAPALQAKYPKVFVGVGKLKDYQLKLNVDPDVTPIAQKPRRVPFALRKKVTAKVEDLIAKDIVERVDGPTSWISPVVIAPKASGDIRLCVDIRKANAAIIRKRIPIPTVDEVLENLNGSTVFSKLDLRLGFHQIELDEGSRDITTFATHDGLFRYKRLSFGVNSAPEKYQQIVTQVISDIGGVQNIADDLIVHGKNNEEHDRNLHRLMQRLEEKNLTLNAEKCQFRMDRVVFMGLLVSKYGIGPTEERVRAVLESSRPTTPTEVRSFLGMVGFSARFIPNFATIAEPLRAISRQGVPFEWGSEQEKAFQKLKQQLASAPVLAYFDKDAHTRVIADASPVGLGAVLVQEKNGVGRAVCYASRSLSSVERRYSQTEKEALALVWACERFNLYLYGLQTFDLVTDHEALKVIYSRGSKPSARIERWVLRLQPYNYKVCYVASRDNIADALSRLTTIPASEKCRYDDEHVRMVALKAVPIAVKIQEIESASAEDEELQAVRNCLVSGNWEKCPRPFVMVRNELTFIGQVILRGTRIVIPKVLRQRVVELAHEGHQGIVKMKERLRSKVWWPGIDKDAGQKCRECYGCQLVTKETITPPVKTTRMPERPWQDVALDLLGPMPTGEYLLVLVDYFSRWVEVDVIKSTTSAVIIKCLDKQFSRYGVPSTLRTDNGPNLVSAEMEGYLEEMGIKHRLTTPLWPRANGEVERQNRSLLKAMRVAHAEKRDWRLELNKFLLAYRSTPHVTTGKSPAELLYGRKMSTKLPEVADLEEPENLGYQQARDHDAEKKQIGADHVDKKHQAAEKGIQEGDLVLLEKRKENKLSPNYEKEPYQVTARYGDQVQLKSPQGVEYKRNIQHVKRFVTPAIESAEPSLPAVVPVEQMCGQEATPSPEIGASPVAAEDQSSMQTPTAPRRSGRATGPPDRFSDYVTT